MSVYDSLTRQYTNLEYLRKPNLADPRESNYILEKYCGFVIIPQRKIDSDDIDVNVCKGILKLRGNNSKISINLGPKRKKKINILEKDHIFEKYWPNNTRSWYGKFTN
jgi:hypothetical protein